MNQYLDLFNSFVTFVSAQPWTLALPLVGLAAGDGVLGYATARKRGESFSFNRFADFMQTSIGAHQLAWVVGSVALVYLTQGSAAAATSLITLAGVNGIAYLKVLADVVSKGQVLLGVKIDPKASPSVVTPPTADPLF